jgi:SAM-dependent methyltransferase
VWRAREGRKRAVLTEYRRSSGQEFWSEHWGHHPVEELLTIARRSPLTTLITRALPKTGAILEAGCGTGQYVLLLRERGWRVAGADWVVEPLVTCRRVAAVPLAAMKLEELAIRDGALAAYISLGAVEHDERGPDAILAEARRALAPGGIMVISVPYVNGVRRLTSPWLRRATARSGIGAASSINSSSPVAIFRLRSCATAFARCHRLLTIRRGSCERRCRAGSRDGWRRRRLVPGVTPMVIAVSTGRCQGRGRARSVSRGACSIRSRC